MQPASIYQGRCNCSSYPNLNCPSILGSEDVHGPTIWHSLFLYQRDMLVFLSSGLLLTLKCDFFLHSLLRGLLNSLHALLGHHFEQYHMDSNFYMTWHSLTNLRPQFKLSVHPIFNVNIFFPQIQIEFNWSHGCERD